jgi:NADPH-dependent 2,4-dienoyl-CoA reductase/sulfur reductase-like enzyme
VTAIDRDRRRVHTAQGELGYDWLISPPASLRLRALAGRRRARHRGHAPPLPGRLRRHANSIAAQQAGRIRGGELLMTVPPGPARCPPAPYERALMIAWWLKTRGIKGA